MRIHLRRGLGSVVLLTLGAAAVVLPVLAQPAQAAAPALHADRSSVEASAGTCTVVAITPTDVYGYAWQGSDTVTVTLAENPNSATQDVDFCMPRGRPADDFKADAPVEDPSYVPATAVPSATTPTLRNSYAAGDTLTEFQTSLHNQGGAPDNASNSGVSSDPAHPGDPSHANLMGVDNARYLYTPSRGTVLVGVVGLEAGTATLKAFLDYGGDKTPQDRDNYRADPEEIQTASIPFTVTAGGYPDGTQPYDAADGIVAHPADGSGTPNSVQRFEVTVTNRNGDTLRGVQPSISVAPFGANPSAQVTCDESDNSGVARCSFLPTKIGRDVLNVWVNHTGGTAGQDSFEVATTVTRTTAAPPAPAASARYVVLSPRDTSMSAGTSKIFTVKVTDVAGSAAQGVTVSFTANGPGQFGGGGKTTTATTDILGQASATLSTSTSDSGVTAVTAAITTTGTQCSQPAGAGTGADATTPAGQCSDSTNATITPRASNGPSPSPSASPARRTTALSTSTPDIQPTDEGLLRAAGTPGALVELRCYSRPSNTYVTARTQRLDPQGRYEFVITPGTNTRCYLRYSGDETTASPSVVVNVHTTLSLSATRASGTRTYVFQGRNLPRLAGQLITLYRVDASGAEIRTSNLTTDSSGIYRVQRSFAGTGTFSFIVRTSKTMNNAAGASAYYRLTIR